MPRDFHQFEWDDATAEDCRHIVRLAVREDLERQQDWTTLALVPPDRVGAAEIVAREAGIVAGLPALAVAIQELDARLTLEPATTDGATIAAGAPAARLRGNMRDLLTSERILLNLLGRLMGIATLTQQYASCLAGTTCRVFDTRKTTPGWRRLEKYAVRCGGGYNHRTGLYDAVLIKDNHLAQLVRDGVSLRDAPAAAVRQARQFLKDFTAEPALAGLIVEVEVESLEQLAAVLPEQPDIVLLDNMTTEQLRGAVALRGEMAPAVELEASGGLQLETLRQIAEAGVDRISVGRITHSAPALDIGLDFIGDGCDG
jgi:nicotinate-nucleotide pyrophosphorylase (carboxylating)